MVLFYKTLQQAAARQHGTRPLQQAQLIIGHR
jgi:hypothetical protein